MQAQTLEAILQSCTRNYKNITHVELIYTTTRKICHPIVQHSHNIAVGLQEHSIQTQDYHAALYHE